MSRPHEARPTHGCTRTSRTRQAWKHCAQQLAPAAADEALDDDVRAAIRSPIPLRCPAGLIHSGPKRAPGLRSAAARRWLVAGEAFVCPAGALLGGAECPMFKWTPEHLGRHLPKEQLWPVFTRGSTKLVMSHTMRYTLKAEREAAGLMEQEPDPRFTRADREMMTFKKYLAAVRAHEAAKASGDAAAAARGAPYFGTDLLWRTDPR